MGLGDTHWWNRKSASEYAVTMPNIRTIGISIFLLATPFLADAAGPTNFRDFVSYIIRLMNIVVGLIVTLTLLIYFWGAVRHITNKEESDSWEMRKFLMTGVIIIFVMVSIWGILEILQNTLKSASGGTGSGQSQQQCTSFGCQ
jgi:heme/copper-type cytochrome/quinol oxidase subunit 4